ncbi:MAG TPA: formate dehydrogenase accessory protein FdhE [Pyrinomonadaceae bacterium]|nr:formate dehydrogenase accessory protein FdhE [Pyrinomonadaceae bacterium]
MSDFWDKQIERADSLAGDASGSKELLRFYAQLLRAQKEIYEAFRDRRGFWLPSGNLESDLEVVQASMSGLLKRVVQNGPESLAAEAQALLSTESNEMAQDLLNYWRNPSDTQFFAKSVIQPYTRWLAETGIAPTGRELAGGERTCPFCGGRPQASFLQSKESGAESGNRDLLCSTCLTSWEFRRVVCASCGEERPAKLGYFHSPEFDHIRIEACDTCKHYLKAIDLTRFGHAVPLVDELYAAPLDLWAREHGYTKIELNLVGL